MRFSTEVLKDEKAPAIALLLVVMRQYGVEVLECQPEFLRGDIYEDFGVMLSDLQSDKLQAAMVILQSDLFQSQWETFTTVCHILNNTPASFEDHTALEAEELASALAQYRLLVGDEAPPFSDEVNTTAGLIFYHYGLSEPPSIFPTAIIPSNAVPADPSEKSKALSELFDARTKAIKEYMESISTHS